MLLIFLGNTLREIRRWIRSRDFLWIFRPSVIGLGLEKVGSGNTFYGYYGERIGYNNLLWYLTYSSADAFVTSLDMTSSIEKRVHRIEVFNWQQGVLLKVSADFVAFNCPSSENSSFVLLNARTNEKITYRFLASDVAFETKRYCGLDFKLLTCKKPEYGYPSAYIAESPLFFICCMVTGDMLSSYSNVDFGLPEGGYVNHTEFSPNERKISLFYRVTHEGVERTHFLIYEEGKFREIDFGMISHTCWINNEELLGFCDGDEGLGYYKWFLQEKGVVKTKMKFLPSVDGHPICIDNKLLVDTYPDEQGYAHIMLYDLTREVLITKARVFQPARFRRGKRVDLHPKIDDRKNYYIESSHSGSRQLYKLTFNDFHN